MKTARFGSAVFSLFVLAAAASFGAEVDDTPDVVDDEAIIHRLETEGGKLVEDKKATPFDRLVKHLTRKMTKAELPVSPGVLHAPDEIYRLCRPGVLILALMDKDTDPPMDWLASPASAYVIQSDGICVSNYHVFEPSLEEETLGLVAMTAAGDILPVTEILAASKVDDIVIFKINTNGKKLDALPLGASAQPGAHVTIISHPAEHFYTYSGGLVSRYAKIKDEQGTASDAMYVTADFARGSSGAPVLNDKGEVVGMVASTESCYYDDDGEAQKDLQMVFKACVPVGKIKKLFKAKKGDEAKD